MNGYDIGYYDKNLTFSADVSVGVADSGFLLQIGQTGSNYEPAVSFSGVSGYLFDLSGNFFGGYQKNRTFNISGNLSLDPNGSRHSYYYDGVLMANNLQTTGIFVDNLRFQNYGGLNTANIDLNIQGGASTLIADSEGVFLLSQDGFFLSA